MFCRRPVNQAHVMVSTRNHRELNFKVYGHTHSCNNHTGLNGESDKEVYKFFLSYYI